MAISYEDQFFHYHSSSCSHFRPPDSWDLPITAAAQSKAWTVFARSNAGIVGWNPTQGMDICCMYAFILGLCCPVLCLGSGLATGWSLAQGVLPSVKRWLCHMENCIKYTTHLSSWEIWILREQFHGKVHYSRSQLPRGLRHELSSLALTLGLWVRIPLRAWMFGVFMRLFWVCAVLCVRKGLATGWSPVQGVLPTVCKIKKLKKQL
jgi:hypothetical protein